MSLPTQMVHLTLPKELVQKMDAEAAQLYLKRSEFIRQSIVEKLRANNPHTLPTSEGVNILMTDAQLQEMWEALRLERLRRKRKGLPY